MRQGVWNRGGARRWETGRASVGGGSAASQKRLSPSAGSQLQTLQRTPASDGRRDRTPVLATSSLSTRYWTDETDSGLPVPRPNGPGHAGPRPWRPGTEGASGDCGAGCVGTGGRGAPRFPREDPLCLWEPCHGPAGHLKATHRSGTVGAGLHLVRTTLSWKPGRSGAGWQLGPRGASLVSDVQAACNMGS